MACSITRLWLACVVLGAGSPLIIALDSDKPVLPAQLMPTRFTLKGQIVDENGKMLSNVSILVRKGRPKDLSFQRSQIDYERVNVNGTFEVDIADYFDVSLFFSREGHYTEERTFVIPVSLDDLALLMAGKRIPQRIVKDENVRIVLEKHGKLTMLRRYVGMLKYSADGSIVAAQMTAEGLSIARSNLEGLPPSCIHLVAGKDKKDQLSITPYRTTGGDKLSYPKVLKLVNNDTQAGFVVFRPVPGKGINRQMKEAPAAGYQRELVLPWTPEQMHNREVIHFFFKLKGKYGRGAASDVGVSDDGKTVSLRVSFDFQPDGSRNLETGE